MPRRIRGAGADCRVRLVSLAGLGFGALRTAGAGGPSTLRVGMELLSLGNPLTPLLLDIVDGPDGAPTGYEAPTGYITSWAAGPLTDPLERQRGDDSMAAQLANGEFAAPADVMDMLAPLGALLDDAATQLGVVPIELSPDHLVHCRGSLRLVGYGRHGYAPARGVIPPASERSQDTVELLGDDIPAPDAPLEEWRAAQVRALARLIGWLSTGRRPTAYGAVTGGSRAAREQAVDRYLRGCGIDARVADLQPGRLREELTTLAAAARRTKITEGLAASDVIIAYHHDAAARGGFGDRNPRFERGLVGGTYLGTVDRVDPRFVVMKLRYGVRVFVPRSGTGFDVDLTTVLQAGEQRPVTVRRFDETLTPRGDPKGLRGVFAPAGTEVMTAERRVNPEPVRLATSLQSGRAAVGVAAFEAADLSSPLAGLLGGSGWLLCPPDDLARTLVALRRVRSAHRAPDGAVPDPARIIAFGVDPAALTEPNALASAGQRVEFALPLLDEDGQAHAPRAWRDLPLVDDVSLQGLRRRIGATAGQSAARRLFAAAFAHLLVNPDESALAADTGSPQRGGRSAIMTMLQEIGRAFAGRPDLIVTVTAELAEQQSVLAARDSAKMLDELAAVLRPLPAERRIVIDVMRLVMRERIRPETRRMLLAETLPATGVLTGCWGDVWQITAVGLTELTEALERVAATGQVLARAPRLDRDAVVSLAVAGAAPAVVRCAPLLPVDLIRELTERARVTPEVLRGEPTR